MTAYEFAHWVELAGPIVILCTLPGALAIPILYGFRAPWYKSHLGRALMMSSVGLAALVVASTVRILFPHWDNLAFQVIRLWVYAVISHGIYYELAVMLVLQRRGTDMHEDHKDTEESP